jgi:hypothetical protein
LVLSSEIHVQMHKPCVNQLTMMTLFRFKKIFY